MNFKDSLMKYKKLERAYGDSIHLLWRKLEGKKGDTVERMGVLRPFRKPIHGADSVRFQLLVTKRRNYMIREDQYDQLIMHDNKN
jgi:hypothetical protein